MIDFGQVLLDSVKINNQNGLTLSVFIKNEITIEYVYTLFLADLMISIKLE